jgi:hypothetical protein
MNEELPPPADETGPDVVTDAESVGSLLYLAHRRSRRAARRQGRRLFSFGLMATAVGIGYLAYNAKVADPIHLYLGIIIFFLAVLPALMWAKEARFGMPLFEAFMLPGVNTFAVPLLRGHQMLRQYDSGTITTAAIAIIAYQACACATYFSLKVRPKRRGMWVKEIVSRDISKVLSYGMIVTTIYTFLVQFTDVIPTDLVSEARAVCFGIGIIATFVQTRRWGEGDLPYYDKIIFVVQLLAQVIFSWVSLFLVQGVTILLLALMGYVSGAKKVPLLAIAIAAPIIAILFNGKAEMRAKYWDAKAPAPGIAEIPAFFTEWINAGLAYTPQKGNADESQGVLDRTSLIQIVCLVVSQSPEHKPYMYGDTYMDIPGQFVPRFFWPGKPLGHVSTYKLCVYYGLETEEQTLETTIGFGMPAEAYANFGFAGMIMLGCFFGFFFKKVAGMGAESPIFSYPGLFMIVLMAWTFLTELPLSAWLASLEQACVAVLGLPFVLKNFFK